MAENEARGSSGTTTAPRNATSGSPARSTAPTGMEPARSQLVTEEGKTRIADGVVAKIAGMAAREIPGVYSMGSGMSRRIGQLRSMMPGTADAIRQGVSVEVGEREAAVDLDVVTWYGQSIVDVCDAVRRNVKDRVQTMTGLKVVEVNITVDDVYVEGEQEDEKESRVQ